MELLVLNTTFESIAVVDTYESLIWTDRYNAYGDFEIFFAMDTGLLEYLKEDNYLWLKESEHCMIIEEIKIDSDTEDGNHLIVTGRSLESILERRIIWGQRIFSGNFQNAIQTMLNDFCAKQREQNKVDITDSFQKLAGYDRTLWELYRNNPEAYGKKLHTDIRFSLKLLTA